MALFKMPKKAKKQKQNKKNKKKIYTKVIHGITFIQECKKRKVNLFLHSWNARNFGKSMRGILGQICVQRKIYTKVFQGITFFQELTFVGFFMGWNSSNPQEHSWKVLHKSHTFAYSPRMFWGLDHNFELLSCGRGRVK